MARNKKLDKPDSDVGKPDGENSENTTVRRAVGKSRKKVSGDAATVVSTNIDPVRPTSPNLKLIDFVRDPEGSGSKMARYQEELETWVERRQNQVEEAPGLLPEVGLDSLKEWSVDLKIYERLYHSEIPFNFPTVWFRDEDVGTYARISQAHQVINDGLPILDLGYKNMMVMATEKGFDEFTEWCRARGGIKIIGIIQVTF